MKQTKRHKLCFGTDKGKTFQNRINTGKNSGDSKTVTLVHKNRPAFRQVYFYCCVFNPMCPRAHGGRARPRPVDDKGSAKEWQ